MYLGHYAAGFFAKAIEPRASLSMLIFAALLLDLIYLPILLSNSLVPIFFQTPVFLDTSSMACFNSAAAMVFCSIAVFIIAKRFLKTSKTTALLLAMVTASHYLLDQLQYFLMMFDVSKTPYLCFALECSLIITAVLYYTKRTYPITQSAKYTVYLLLAALVVTQISLFYHLLTISSSSYGLSLENTINIATLIFVLIFVGLIDHNRKGGFKTALK